jgi:hypothetical protein
MFSFFLGACGESRAPIPVDVKYLITPDYSPLSENTIFSDLLKEYRYIIPEATDDSFFAYIYKAYIDRDRIYILDKKTQDKILVFDLDTGEFIRSIGSLGRAENEYTSLGNFTLDKINKNVMILDETLNKVLTYCADTGAFKNSFSLGFIARNIEYVNENTIAYTGGGQNMDRLRLTDFEGNELGAYIPSNDKNWVMPINSFSRGDTGEVVYKTYLSDSIYTVTPDGPIASRFVDFGEDALTWRKFTAYSKHERDNINDYLGIYRTNMKYYSETDSHVWFIYSNKNIPTCVVYNKETSYVFSYPMSIVNNIVFDKYAPLIVASDENYFIGQNDAYSVVDNIEQSGQTAIPDDLKDLSYNANPIILLLKFK